MAFISGIRDSTLQHKKLTLKWNKICTSSNTTILCFIILYIKMNVCIYVCLYVCLFLIQIHISAPTGTKLCTRLPRGLEETVGYVWTHNILPSPPIRRLSSRRPAWRCAKMAAGCAKMAAEATGRSSKALYPWLRHVSRDYARVETCRCVENAERVTACTRVNVETRWHCGEPNDYTDFPTVTCARVCVASMHVYMWPSFSPVVWKRP
jgi:hypothetical protein